MKKFEEVYTPEQLEALRTTYFIGEGDMYCPIPGGKPTRGNLKIVDLDEEIVLTADDLEKDEDGDFTYIYNKNGNYTWICRSKVPKEVVKILDAVIDESEAAKKE